MRHRSLALAVTATPAVACPTETPQQGREFPWPPAAVGSEPGTGSAWEQEERGGPVVLSRAAEAPSTPGSSSTDSCVRPRGLGVPLLLRGLGAELCLSADVAAERRQ